MLRRSRGGHRAGMRPALEHSLVAVLALACGAVVILAPGAQAGRAALTAGAPLDRQEVMHSSRQLLQTGCTATTCSTVSAETINFKESFLIWAFTQGTERHPLLKQGCKALPGHRHTNFGSL